MTTGQKQALRLFIITTVTVVLFLSVYFHANYINGSSYWKWMWQKIENSRMLLSLFIFAIPFVMGQILYAQKKWSTSSALLWMMASVFLGQMLILAVQTPQFNFIRIAKIVSDPVATSYFTDAFKVTNVKDFLSHFPNLLPTMHLHAVNKPPGLILYYWLMLKWFPHPHIAAFMGGLLIGGLTTLVIPSTFFMVRTLLHDREAAFYSASAMVFMPGMILFFPEFDQVFPILTCLLVGFWVLALEKDRLIHSFIFGIMLSLILFLTWNVLVAGIFLILMTVYFLVVSKGKIWIKILKHALIAITVIVGVYGFLWNLTGYNPIETFSRCLFMQNLIAPHRPYPLTIFFDLTDFFLGAGWLPLILGGMVFVRQRAGKLWDRSFWISIFVFLQILLVAVCYLLPGETTRVWIFLLPLFVIPMGLELKTFNFWQRMIIFGCLWLLVGVIGQNLIFI